nr:hypothetical protein [Bacteroidota bacterium]
MEKKFAPFYYGSDAPTYISYDIPVDTLNRRFDFSQVEDQFKNDTSFKSIKKIFAIIEEIHDRYLVLNCMIDEKKKITQKRKFDIEPFINEFDLVEGEGVEIIIRTGSGIREFLYRKSDSSKILFEEPEDLFSKYKGTSLFPIKRNENNLS